MTATRFADTFPDLRDRRVVVVGAGKSGRAAANLALQRSANVTLTDRREARAWTQDAEALRARGATLVAGGHPLSLLDAADLVVLSPGVPPEIELAALARARGIPVWGEVELAFRHTRGRVVGITGSNGKSTVTAMTGAMLRAAGIAGGTGGNLDTPLADLLELDRADAVHALELSSFQLETIDVFRPSVAVVLNLSADHLDRHGTLDAYASAKARIFENQTDDDDAIVNADDRPSRFFDDFVRANVHTFSTRVETARGAFVCDETLTLRTRFGDEALIRVAEMPVPGEHNLSNALAAALAARLAGAPVAAIADALHRFEPLAHRLEHVADVSGVRFYNDSKATNPAAALPALDAFDAGTIHLIVGGKDKGGDWDALVDAARERARRVLVIGTATEAIAGRFSDACEVVECGTLELAVDVGFNGAASGDVVLLSPACASFDQFESFEQRGEAFRSAVKALGGGHA